MQVGVALSTILLAPAAIAQVLTQSTVASVGGANALSTPAARHLARMDSGTYLLALQRDRAVSNPGLSLFRSDDDGQTWSWYAALNPSASDRHTADLLRAGDDLAIVESFDAPSIVPDANADPARKVWFQWWRGESGQWQPQPRVAVFDPAPGAAYHRGEIAIDALGRIWVQAFRRAAASCDPATNAACAQCLNVANGDNYANDVVVSVSADGGKTFSPGQTLASTLCRAGGRLIDLGQRLLLIWNDYSANENGTRIVTKFVTRDVGDPPTAWSTPQDAFPDEPADGIYHGAALSAVADGTGGLHLVYKDQNDLRLWYRWFDGEKFGARVQVDDSSGDWALQPAVMLRDGDLFVLANHRTGLTAYETRMWRLSAGFGPQRATPLGDADGAFHGYPTLPESIPASVSTFPYAFASTPDSDQPGDEVLLRIAVDPPAADLAASPGTLRSIDGAPATATLTLLPRNGFRGALAFSVAGVPANARASLAQTTVTASAGAASTQLTLVPGDAEAGEYHLLVKAVSSRVSASVGVTWSIERSVPSPPPGGGTDPQSGTAGSQGGGGCASTGAEPAALLAVALFAVRRRFSSRCRAA